MYILIIFIYLEIKHKLKHQNQPIFLKNYVSILIISSYLIIITEKILALKHYSKRNSRQTTFLSYFLTLSKHCLRSSLLEIIILITFMFSWKYKNLKVYYVTQFRILERKF